MKWKARMVELASLVMFASIGASMPAGAVTDEAACAGDCNTDRRVTVDELIHGVRIALGGLPLSTCAALDANDDTAVTVEELVGAVRRAVGGCEQCAAYNPLRNAYFGDLHVHTTYSFDVHAFDVRTTPAQAYRFAHGDPVALPPLDETGQGTVNVRLERPLDFVAVTDHSEFLGEVEVCTTPGSAAYDSTTCALYRAGGNPATRKFGLLLTTDQPERLSAVCGADGQGCQPAASEVWNRIVTAANDANDTSSACTFTAFVAYEYSGGPGLSTLHRNVIFRNDHVPFPTNFFDQPTPRGLWTELKATCLDSAEGCDVLAIPHNSNESNGNMFYVEYPDATSPAEARDQARFRAAMEPVVEIYQHKGDSECMNGLSGIVGAPDEQCTFEKRRRPNSFADCGNETGQMGTIDQGCVSRLDFVRNVLLTGLQENDRIGANPYQLGIIASTDTHNGTPGLTEERSFNGHRGTDDNTVALQLGNGLLYAGGIIFNPGGLAGVWAQENSRDSIFNALRRREVFGTSGTRIAVRVFGGWNLPANLCAAPDWLQTADAYGVPMGAVLPPRPGGGGAPRFVINALRDPGTNTRPGMPLQRLQMIKGWVDGLQSHEQVFDVAGDPNNGADVDLATCTPRGAGFDGLCTVWTDPSFAPNQRAFYYVRVLENPTCRWSTYTCNALTPDQRPPSCTDPGVPKTIQERAWSSPIWYQPDA